MDPPHGRLEFSTITPYTAANSPRNSVTDRAPDSLPQGGGSKFDLVDDEMIDIHRKFRAFVTFLQNETGFMNALTADLLWKSLFVKYE